MFVTFEQAVFRASQLGVGFCVDWQKLRGLTNRAFTGQAIAVEGYLQSLMPCGTDLPAVVPFIKFRYPTKREYFPDIKKEIPDIKEILSVDKNKVLTRKFLLPVVLSAIAYFLFFG